jgi:hypothetical protein
MDKNSTHRELLQAVHRYVKIYLKLETKPTFSGFIEIRQALSDIKKLAGARRFEVQKQAKEKREIVSKLKGKNSSSDN